MLEIEKEGIRWRWGNLLSFCEAGGIGLDLLRSGLVPGYNRCMATAVKSLHVGELVDVDGRRYEVVPDAEGDLTLEPTITPMAELDRRRGAKPASQEDFDRLFGHLPTDGEG